MSKYLSFSDVVFKDRETLVSALVQIGCQNIKQGEAIEMGRYYAEQTKQTAEIIVSRHTIGNYFGDIGFVRTTDDSYTPIMDDLDKSRALEGKFMTRLRAAYNEQVVARVATRLHGTMHRTQSGNVLKIKVRY